MEAQPGSGPTSSSVVAYPRWVMLEQYLEVKFEDSSTDDTKTMAAARTRNCHPIKVSLCLAEAPALSRVCLQIPDDGLQEEKSMVLAAHGDSVLIKVFIREVSSRGCDTADHFVYNAGAAGADPPRPPSLSLLPPLPRDLACFVPLELSDDATGLLRRGEDELVVAELSEWSYTDDPPTTEAELYMFRSNEWKYYQFEIREAWGLSSVHWNTVVPVGDRRLCWVSLYRGVMLVDVFEETPILEYVPLPMDHDDTARSNRNVCATAGGSALKFINIFGRCCCGAAASCGCERSHHAYTIHTWTMRIDGGGDMEWVKDGIVDATELWTLNGYKGLPCDPLDLPVVSLEEPELVSFRLKDTKYGRWSLWHWQIMVNMRSKTIHSVSRHEQQVSRHEQEQGVFYRYDRDKLIPSNVSCLFNALTGQIQMDDEKPPPAVAVDEQPTVRDDDSSNPMLQASFFAELSSVQALQEMFEALQEIPSYGLGPDEVKAYRILNSDNGHRLTSLLRLPKDMRKDWLLMEIKVNDAY